MSATWDERIGRFWARADDAEPERMRRELSALILERRADDPDVLFERASLHDYLGEEEAAIPLYRAALAGGLADPHRTAATIQLASSLRNVGQPSAAIALLQHVPADDPLADAARAFLALALLDDAKPGPALRTALHALAPHLPAYNRAVEMYADEAMSPPRARNVVVALIVQDGWVLAEEYAATGDHGSFLRAPGGGLEFGETTAAGMRRELDEELAADVQEARLLAVTENIFTLGPKHGHEIVHVFAVRSTRLEALPRGSRLPVLDSDTTVGWYRIDDLAGGDPPFYPDGILDLARQLAAGEI
ncbi:tetratricopeptide repeat protein [Microbacterium sp. W1N]|uniref:tetratricopeptide repeat protein n=1 Tax=Microbacterium festucae TaxID=2977531 RepID=UPI0021BF0F11|nr:tetratricopeptide repeat protein [Microbacterium festucae]MCT9820112.1 tetratricopeptide repeat protein [Microbacterium festucae]